MHAYRTPWLQLIVIEWSGLQCSRQRQLQAHAAQRLAHAAGQLPASRNVGLVGLHIQDDLQPAKQVQPQLGGLTDGRGPPAAATCSLSRMSHTECACPTLASVGGI